MKLTAHCFAEDVKITPPKFNFALRDLEVELLVMPGARREDKERLMLSITRVVTKLELDEFKKKIENQDDPNAFFLSRSRPYNEALTEVAQLVEGLLAILFVNAPPKFNTARVWVNLTGENKEEDDLLLSDEIMRGFGHLTEPPKYPDYQMKDVIKGYIPIASLHVPALAFQAQALRSFKNNDQEVAFFLYFRIIDGYFAHGSKDVLKALLKNASELAKYLVYDNILKNSLKDILNEIRLPSDSATDFNGLIKDIVRVRHQLTHFSSKKAASHHSPKIWLELATVNSYLNHACTKLLREEIGVRANI